jgi:hypothetical protein
LTVLLASAVPATVGVVLFVLNGEVAGVVIAGAAGAVVSMMIVFEAEAPLTFVAASVAVAVIVCEPTASAEVESVQLPEPSAVVVPTRTALS